MRFGRTSSSVLVFYLSVANNNISRYYNNWFYQKVLKYLRKKIILKIDVQLKI